MPRSASSDLKWRIGVRLRRATLLLVLLANVVASAGAPVSVKAETRTLTVTPSSGLANQVVQVSWSGFRQTAPNGDFSVVVYQCSGAPRSLADCFTADPYPALQEGTRQIGRTGPDGTGTIEFEVRPAANLPLLNCSEMSPCSIVAFENDGVAPPDGALPATAVVAPLTFARSQADCPKVTDFDIRADGSASAAPLLYAWAARLCTGTAPLVVDVTETSALAGIENFLAGLVDIGITSMPATADQISAHPERGEVTYAPIGLTALTVVVNMRDPFTGNRLTDIVLSPRLVARLITDSNTASFLSDPELRRLNPGVRFPTVGLASPLLRAERNEDTLLATNWIARDPSAAAFVAGQDSFGVTVNGAYRGYPYPRESFENVAQSSQFLPRTGQRNVALRLFYGVRPAGSARELTEEVGFIGIVDLPTARRFGLPTARIVNASGTPVAPTDEAVLAGYGTMIRDASGVRVADPTTAVAAAYPLVKIDYAMVSTVAPTSTKAERLKQLLSYAVGDGQQVLPPGYLPLPDELRSETGGVIGRIAAPVPTTTSTTAAPSSTAATVTTRPFNINAGSGSVTGSGSSISPVVPEVTSAQPETGTTLASEGDTTGDDDATDQDVASSPPEVPTTTVPDAVSGAVTPGQMATLTLPSDDDLSLLPLIQLLSLAALLVWSALRLPAAARWLTSMRARRASPGAVGMMPATSGEVQS